MGNLGAFTYIFLAAYQHCILVGAVAESITHLLEWARLASICLTGIIPLGGSNSRWLMIILPGWTPFPDVLGIDDVLIGRRHLILPLLLRPRFFMRNAVGWGRLIHSYQFGRY